MPKTKYSRSQDFRLAQLEGQGSIEPERYANGQQIAFWEQINKERKEWEQRGIDDWLTMTEDERDTERKRWHNDYKRTS